MKHVALWIVSVLLILLSAIIPAADSRCAWISRAGGLIVTLGILWESWPLLTTARADDLPMWTSPEAHSAVRHAILVTCFGTLIWAYAEPVCAALSR
jgi:hypothetical protein